MPVHECLSDAHLLWSKKLHVGGGNQMIQVLLHAGDIGVYSHLVFPFKLHPHLAELLISAAGRHNVIHDVNVNVIEDHTVAITGGTAYIINWTYWTGWERDEISAF